MFVEEFVRVECCGCNASFSVVAGDIDTSKYGVCYCAYCGDENVEIEIQEAIPE